MKKIIFTLLFGAFLCLSCSTNVEMYLPRGLQGEKGDKGDKGDPGDNGLTPYIVDGYWWIGDFATGVKALGVDGRDGKDGRDGQTGQDGQDGKDGQDGQNGQNGKDGKDGTDGRDGRDGDVPYIKNGYWWIAGENTGVPARGKDGKDGEDGLSAYDLWIKAGNHGSMKDFLRSLKGADGEDGKNGKDGLTPFIRNGYWWIGEYNTRIKATGEDGEDGKDGEKGNKGASAYDLWKREVERGLDNTRKDLYDGRNWPKNRTSMDDFWDYLSGIDGINGKNGKDGEDGKDLDKPDAAYIDVPRNIYDLFSLGTGYVSTVSANYPWTYRIIPENNNIKVDDYFSNINVVYETTYNAGKPNEIKTNNGSIALTVKKIPERNMKFEIRFETHNGNYVWVHNSIVITLHAYEATRSSAPQGGGFISLNPIVE